MVNQQLGGNEG